MDMIGHVPTLVHKEFLSCYVKDNGYYVVAIYEGRGGGYEEVVSFVWQSLSVTKEEADGGLKVS
jgi:hypothetical protein